MAPTDHGTGPRGMPWRLTVLRRGGDKGGEHSTSAPLAQVPRLPRGARTPR